MASSVDIWLIYVISLNSERINEITNGRIIKFPSINGLKSGADIWRKIV